MAVTTRESHPKLQINRFIPQPVQETNKIPLKEARRSSIRLQWMKLQFSLRALWRLLLNIIGVVASRPRPHKMTGLDRANLSGTFSFAFPLCIIHIWWALPFRKNPLKIIPDNLPNTFRFLFSSRWNDSDGCKLYLAVPGKCRCGGSSLRDFRTFLRNPCSTLDKKFRTGISIRPSLRRGFL